MLSIGSTNFLLTIVFSLRVKILLDLIKHTFAEYSFEILNFKSSEYVVGAFKVKENLKSSKKTSYCPMPITTWDIKIQFKDQSTQQVWENSNF